MKSIISYIMILCVAGTLNAQPWKLPASGAMLTPWAESIDPTAVLAEYPRPIMERDQWQNLNGIWEFQQGFEGDKAPFGKRLSGQILVPFPWESSLSGVHDQFDSYRGWYRRTFSIPSSWDGQRVLLHFGAVDWQTFVYINGECVGSHTGGYDAFSFDITKFLDKSKKDKQEIVVSVYDPTDRGNTARGKQAHNSFKDPAGCFYTGNSGIWQTVWMEPVPELHIKDIKIVPNLDQSRFEVKVTPAQRGDCRVKVSVMDGDKEVAKADGRFMDVIKLQIADPKLWSTADPYLYDVVVSLERDDKVIDRVKSYAGMRKISIRKFNDVPRLCLNDEPLYQHGPLDQGYWPDGISTAPSDEALKWDVQQAKEWGFNMIRKHVKIEPQRWYYWCDKLGVLVWQDMPCGGGIMDEQYKNQFEAELASMVYQHWNHPSIVMWVVFNEHWGLFDVERLTENTMRLDPSRLVMGNSGIDARNPHVDYEIGHIKDNHSYLPPNLPLVSHTRATVNGEYGALGYAIKEHQWSDNGKYFHNYYKDKSDKKAAATDEYVKFMEQVHRYIKDGLSATVYTQWTDVENEVNGLYTYDRKVEKLDKERVKAANLKCYEFRP